MRVGVDVRVSCALRAARSLRAFTAHRPDPRGRLGRARSGGGARPSEHHEPRALLAHARNDAPELVGALTDFFRTHGHLYPPSDLAGRRAAARRARRIEATPDLL